MIFFLSSEYGHLKRIFMKHRKFKAGLYKLKEFENGTALVTVQSDVRNKECIIVASAVGESLVEALLLSHTLKKEGARKVTAVFPYLAYARDDEDVSGESWGMRWLGEECVASGIDEVVTVDIHSPAAVRACPIPVVSLQVTDSIALAMRKEPLRGRVCVAPDEGAVDNCCLISQALGLGVNIAWFKKERLEKGVKITGFRGEVGSSVIVADDVLDTGGTLLKACGELRNMGVKNMVVVVTHGLFNGSAWKKLWRTGVSRIYCSDTNPKVRRLSSETIVVVPVGKAIVGYFLQGERIKMK